MELFRTITPRVSLRTYQSRAIASPPNITRWRKHVYQMYELINHLQLFGTEYLKPPPCPPSKSKTTSYE